MVSLKRFAGSPTDYQHQKKQVPFVATPLGSFMKGELDLSKVPVVDDR